MSNITRMNFTISSTELRYWGSVGVVGWDAAWAHVLCGQGGDISSLRARKWVYLNCKAGVVGFGRHGCHWCQEVELCWVWRTVAKIGQVGFAAVYAFWRYASGFFAFPHCMWLITFDALGGGLISEINWMTKRLAVKALMLGAYVLIPSYDALTNISDL
jgi:hypothetical protein